MFLFLAIFGLSDNDICTTLYAGDCPICISHFADRQCGFCDTTKTCMLANQSSKCTKFLVGPGTECGKEPAPTPVLPTYTPVPVYSGPCDIYSTCEECTVHGKSDRNCGWCQTTGKCEHINESKCNETSFYHDNNAKCGAIIYPTVTPWPRYDANATFCYSMTGTWCQKCVSANVSMQCGWCASTKECIMGDELGPLFGSCKDWSYTEDDKCLGLISPGKIVAVRVVIAIVITVLIVFFIFSCYRIIKNPKENGFEQLPKSN